MSSQRDDIFYPKGHVHNDTFLVIIQHHHSGTEGQSVTIFQIWSDTDLETLICEAHPLTRLIVQIFCAAGLNVCEESKL